MLAVWRKKNHSEIEKENYVFGLIWSHCAEKKCTYSEEFFLHEFQMSG